MGICVNCKSMRIPCTQSIEALSSRYDNKSGKKRSSSTASNNPHQGSYAETPLTIEQKTSLNSGAELNGPFAHFARLMLDEINLARTDPKKYSMKLKNLLHLIKTNPTNNKIYLLYDDDVKIELKKGGAAFKSCIKYLKNAPSVSPIRLIDDLAIPFPKNNPKQCLNKEYIGECIEKIKSKVKYEIYDFQYDISPNPVLSTIVQVVDDSDSQYQRRGNIMSENVKYVGISYGEIKKGVFCFYLLFAC